MASWNPGEEMTREFAIEALKGMRQFYNRLYHLKEKEPFNGKADFETAIAVIDGLKEFIENVGTEQSVENRNA